MAIGGFAMSLRNVLTAAVAGLALWLAVPGATPAAATELPPGKAVAGVSLKWYYFDSYRSYYLAEDVADELEYRGYDTKIVYAGGGWSEGWYR
jgi:hypothetical protein